jgi:hypothetical protein
LGGFYLFFIFFNFFIMKPEILNSVQLNITTYDSDQEARSAWGSMSSDKRLSIARTYQAGFAGPPWFEVGKCQQCGRFTDNTSTCANCSSEEVNEAYPTEELVEDFLPDNLAAFAPGVFVDASTPTGEVLGFATGGEVALADLITKKYALEEPEEILTEYIRVVSEATGWQVARDSKVFYENEAVVNPKYQGYKLGGKLNQRRLQYFAGTDVPLLVGRTVNKPWLQVKRKQLGEMGFEVVELAPQADSYRADGQPRILFSAFRNE